MARWVMKSEPGTYSWQQLISDGSTEWDGVRNAAARLHLKAMKRGDEAFFYHSGEERSVVGIMSLARAAAPEPGDPNWVSVKVEPVRALGSPVSLKAIKAEPRLAKIELIRQSRLSVSPVRDEVWALIVEMGG